MLNNILQLGMIFSIISVASYLLIGIINFSDLTVNSSFTLGAVTSGVMVLNGINPFVAVLCSGLSGICAGFLTAFLHLKVKISDLLAGVISMTALYSVNMRILGKPNVSLLKSNTIFSFFDNSTLVIFLILLLICTLLILFLFSEIGLAIRMSGQNYKMGEVYGVGKSFTVFITLGLANALVAIAGAVFSQLYGFVDVNMGNGILIIGITSMVIGQVLDIRKISSPFYMILFSVIGALLYQFVITASLEASFIGFKSSDVPLISSVLVIITFWVKNR